MGRSDSRPPPPSGLCFPRGRCRFPEGSVCGARARSLTPLLPHAATPGHSAHTVPLARLAMPRRVSQVPCRSVGTRPPQSPRVARRVPALIASPPVADFAFSGWVVATDWCNEAESGSLALGSLLRRPGCAHPIAPQRSPGRPDCFPLSVTASSWRWSSRGLPCGTGATTDIPTRSSRHASP